MDLKGERLIDLPPQGTRHDEVLKDAIAGIVAPELQEIARCLKAAKDDLIWREDNAQFYPILVPNWARDTQSVTYILC